MKNNNVLKMITFLKCVAFCIFRIGSICASRKTVKISAPVNPSVFSLSILKTHVHLNTEKTELTKTKPEDNQGTNGPVNAHLRPEIYTNKLV